MDKYENIELQAVADQEAGMACLNFFKPLDDIVGTREFVGLRNGTMLFFGRGSQDDWCPWVLRCGDMLCSMPSDMVYFNSLLKLADICGPEPLYLDIRHVFEHTTGEVSHRMVEHIADIARKYAYFDKENAVYRALMHIYYGMVSEENYGKDRYGVQAGAKPAVLAGKRIKMLSVHKLLREGGDVDRVCRACRGRTSEDIIAECDRRLIYRF